MTRFGEFIRKEREKLNLTQTQFGALIGLNLSAVSRIENGSQTLSRNKLEKLAKLFTIELQTIRDKFHADKFADEAFRNKCSEQVFQNAETYYKYLKQINTIQGELDI